MVRSVDNPSSPRDLALDRRQLLTAAALAAGGLLIPTFSGAAVAATADARSRLAAGDPTSFTIAETLVALDGGRYTSVELVRAFLARIKIYEPTYNALPG